MHQQTTGAGEESGYTLFPDSLFDPSADFGGVADKWAMMSRGVAEASNSTASASSALEGQSEAVDRWAMMSRGIAETAWVDSETQAWDGVGGPAGMRGPGEVHLGVHYRQPVGGSGEGVHGGVHYDQTVSGGSGGVLESTQPPRVLNTLQVNPTCRSLNPLILNAKL